MAIRFNPINLEARKRNGCSYFWLSPGGDVAPPWSSWWVWWVEVAGGVQEVAGGHLEGLPPDQTHHFHSYSSQTLVKRMTSLQHTSLLHTMYGPICAYIKIIFLNSNLNCQELLVVLLSLYSGSALSKEHCRNCDCKSVYVILLRSFCDMEPNTHPSYRWKQDTFSSR